MPNKVVLCDYCLDAFHEEGFPGNVEELADVAWMGSDIADHLCEATESGGKCDCGCH